MNEKIAYLFGLASFKKTQSGELFTFYRMNDEIHIAFVIHTHMEVRWELFVNYTKVPCAQNITYKTLRHMLIGFGFLEKRDNAFLFATQAVVPD